MLDFEAGSSGKLWLAMDDGIFCVVDIGKQPFVRILLAGQLLGFHWSGELGEGRAVGLAYYIPDHDSFISAVFISNGSLYTEEISKNSTSNVGRLGYLERSVSSINQGDR
ncbi:hypothetical protein [Paenibacillus phocaensis]|uniref:hypothetical protein n=1 Tax=Paenibacillus phocaensis TaxID=1776378 RepID=UPI0018E23BF1|nr:hypothetical protein [Paenibacillus phocaensis]